MQEVKKDLKRSESSTRMEKQMRENYREKSAGEFKKENGVDLPC